VLARSLWTDGSGAPPAGRQADTPETLLGAQWESLRAPSGGKGARRPHSIAAIAAGE
jgi:hypothetical protein